MNEADFTSVATVVHWYNMFRNCIDVFFITHPTEISGINKHDDQLIVEIDKSKYFRQKYNVGFYYEGYCFIGGVDRESAFFSCKYNLTPQKSL